MENSGSGGGSGGASVSSWKGGAGEKIEKAAAGRAGKGVAFLTAAAVILIGTFGLEGVRRMEVPVIQLMAGTRLPGKFLERFDIVWLALLLCSILFALGSLLFYGTHLTGMRGDKGRIFRAAMGALIYGGSVLGQEEAEWNSGIL